MNIKLSTTVVSVLIVCGINLPVRAEKKIYRLNVEVTRNKDTSHKVGSNYTVDFLAFTESSDYDSHRQDSNSGFHRSNSSKSISKAGERFCSKYGQIKQVSSYLAMATSTVIGTKYIGESVYSISRTSAGNMFVSSRCQVRYEAQLDLEGNLVPSQSSGSFTVISSLSRPVTGRDGYGQVYTGTGISHSPDVYVNFRIKGVN